MTPKEYCYNKAAIPGSALSLSTRKLDSLRRDGVVAICAFYKEIEDITLNWEDLNVAQTKLNWWRNQVIQLADNKASHPVTQMLQKILPAFSLNPLHFIAMIDGLEQNLSAPQFDTFEDIIVHVMRTAGTREFLIAALLQKTETIPQETLYQFSLVLELVNYLQHLHRYVSKGLIFFSPQELQQFNVDPDALRTGKTTDNLRKLFHAQALKIDRAYEQAITSLSPKQKREAVNIIVRCEVALGILDAIQANRYRVLERRIDITPLRCWWISWLTTARC